MIPVSQQPDVPDSINIPDPHELTGTTWRQQEYIGHLLSLLPTPAVPRALWQAVAEEKDLHERKEKYSELILWLQKSAGVKRCYRVVDEDGKHNKESLGRLYGQCYAERWDVEDIITHIRRRKDVDKSKSYDVDRIDVPWEIVSDLNKSRADRQERPFVNYIPPTERPGGAGN